MQISVFLKDLQKNFIYVMHYVRNQDNYNINKEFLIKKQKFPFVGWLPHSWKNVHD